MSFCDCYMSDYTLCIASACVIKEPHLVKSQMINWCSLELQDITKFRVEVVVSVYLNITM